MTYLGLFTACIGVPAVIVGIAYLILRSAEAEHVCTYDMGDPHCVDCYERHDAVDIPWADLRPEDAA